MSKCPSCGESEDIHIVTEGQEDDHQEQIENFLVCEACGYDERDG